MSEPQFFQTKMGQQFYDGTMPRIAKALEAIAKQVETKGVVEALEKQIHDLDKLVDELLTLIHDHDTAWEDEEPSVIEEHIQLIRRTRALLERCGR